MHKRHIIILDANCREPHNLEKQAHKKWQSLTKSQILIVREVNIQ
jgi:hypothetical protein